MKLLSHRCLFLLVIGATVVAMVRPQVLVADVFVLKSGGRINGTRLDREDLPRTKLVIQTRGGGEITLDRDQIAEVISQKAADLEYEKIRYAHPDTVDGHWLLSEWCRENRLNEERKTHLRRIIELDPDHAKARSLLEYRKVDGEWMTRDEEMAGRGMIYHKGRYRSAQEIVLLERASKQKKAHGEWLKKLKRWRGWLGANDQGKYDQAREEILAIRDAYATQAITLNLHKEDSTDVKLLYLQALSQIGTPSAIKTLVNRSLVDGDIEVRLSCLDYLVAAAPPGIVGQYVKALVSKSNDEVNRAAVALKMLGDPDAISPLVDSLITVHKTRVGGGQEGQMNATFSPQGDAGLSMGSKRARIVKEDFRNPDVLDALVVLSGGANFIYDVQAWRVWHSTQRKLRNLDARRD